jgi:hypothetical protein
MDTLTDSLDTISTNWTSLSNTPIDWSGTGGVPWLLGMTIVMVAAMIIETLRSS